MPTYTVACYHRDRFVGWVSMDGTDVPEPIEIRQSSSYPPKCGDKIGVDGHGWLDVRATVGAEPVRLVLAEDK